ncbi:MAG: hypothetical protein ACD_63C00194G0002 [uncultured bacterium]|nr:MAG: hypothetical protein ACD_63C00194G0002 [uncultured bacterium]
MTIKTTAPMIRYSLYFQISNPFGDTVMLFDGEETTLVAFVVFADTLFEEASALPRENEYDPKTESPSGATTKYKFWAFSDTAETSTPAPALVELPDASSITLFDSS